MHMLITNGSPECSAIIQKHLPAVKLSRGGVAEWRQEMCRRHIEAQLDASEARLS